MIKHYNIIRMY